MDFDSDNEDVYGGAELGLGDYVQEAGLDWDADDDDHDGDGDDGRGGGEDRSIGSRATQTDGSVAREGGGGRRAAFGGKDGVLSAPLGDMEYQQLRSSAQQQQQRQRQQQQQRQQRQQQGARGQGAGEAATARDGRQPSGVAGRAQARQGAALSDSDDEDERGYDEAALRAAQPTDDELFYDPNIDDENELWVKEMRARTTQGQVAHAKNVQGGLTAAPESDAVLNCPACLTPLCLDCQRHELYPTQFRAMFVMNCRVDYSQEVVFREKMEAKKKRKQHSARGKEPTTEDLFHPTHCATCNTVVAMLDKDEVFHFFNVVESSA
ncbi:hypothetical protein PTSG_02514 [Salpingoeca rosetta]|uniref:E2F-associated phosphoprotein n=1 Tax=Salpingoeca rosetta (strain ATCC 50818 / BSB-021) TaxID=946362 RepID=F2U2F0_SALR5|nr:uncharacterized protein PTSG_02514 [Salpingoeca rosetta]EGD81802.1 hypothetical protein PTSG_02514 [Salpingoeca rosetta]|eukprot:XP_004997006.1 hypothetical protein PTSG_02514 [Salpingoeca rosetta]